MEDTTSYEELIEARRYPHKDFISTLRFLLTLLAVFSCFTILFTQILLGVQVVGHSMEPTLYTGDYLFINTLLSPQREDIVVVEANEKDSVHDSQSQKWIIKRVIALPGDTIYADSTGLYRKNAGEDEFMLVNESYLEEPWQGYIAEQTLKENEYYVMGDNRKVSHDSRAFGPVLRKDIKGVVTDWSYACKGFLTGLFNLFS